MKHFLAFLITFITISISAQHGYRDSNRIGISGGITQLSLFSEQFNVTPGKGWIGGLSLRGNYYNNWQGVYGMHFTDSNFSLQATNNKDINFKLSAAQIYFVFSYMVIENHLTLEIGPVLQINGKLKVSDDDKKLFLKDSPLLQAEDILNITKINGNLYAGVSAGVKNFKVHVSYQYGFNNIMNNLNKSQELKVQNGNQRFRANLGLLSAMLIVYL